MTKSIELEVDLFLNLGPAERQCGGPGCLDGEQHLSCSVVNQALIEAWFILYERKNHVCRTIFKKISRNLVTPR